MEKVSGLKVIAQVRYRTSPAALQTAITIVDRKLRNCLSLLKKHNAYQRIYPERHLFLRKRVNSIENFRVQLGFSSSLSKLFLAEAQAARHYWRAIALLFLRHNPQWQRVYPHAADPINLLLNTGYTLLSRWLKEVILAVGLLPEIGIFHQTKSGRMPLVYDLMELFRQPLIDAVVIPLFTKKKQAVADLDNKDMARAVKLFEKQWQKSFRYRGRCLSLKNIAVMEIVSLAKSMLKNLPWQPYCHSWGHNWTCVK